MDASLPGEHRKTKKRNLAENTILQYSDFNKTFVLQTDASTEAIGYIVSQKEKNNAEHVVG